MNQIIVHCEEQVTQMALLEQGQLIEYAVERAEKTLLVGSFFKGRVVNVLPGMQAAFVDIGQKKNAFLYVDDCFRISRSSLNRNRRYRAYCISDRF